MANFNKVILMGNLTRDPELKYLPSNTAVCEFGLAVNRTWRDANGQQQEDTCFVDCACFGRAAETLNQYMSKGKPLLIDGRLKYDSWTAQDGTKRSKLRVVVENFQFVGGRGEGGGGGAGGSGGGERPERPQRDSGRRQAPEPSGRRDDYDSGPGPSDEDIPF